MKSPPELWAECSEASSLARHLEQFGEIQITRLEPETAVAWEGEHASGTVRLEPSGWGTRVILTVAESKTEEPAPPDPLPPDPLPPDPLPPDPLPPAAAAPPARTGLIARLLGWFRPARGAVPARARERPRAPERPRAADRPRAPEQQPTPSDPPDPSAVLSAALDSLGQAHRRPFSRG